MKTLKLIIWILPVLLLFSCGKEYPSVPDSSQDQLRKTVAACGDGCDATQLVHHPAVQETADKGGNLEYWECPHCGNVYSDPEGKQAITGYLFTLPTRFLKDLSPIASLSLKRPQTKGNAAASVELAASIISLCAGIATISVSVASLTQSVEDVEAAYYKLEAQSNKTEEEIEQMQKYYAQIESDIDDLMGKTAELNVSLQTMSSSMTELNATLQEVDETLMEIIQAIKDLVDDVRANLILDNRHLLRSALSIPVEACVYALSHNLNESLSGLEQAESFSDTLDVFREISDRQLNVINQWALDENDRVADVMTLISTFNSVSYNYSENIPAFLEQYANHHFTWEHHGISFRRAYLLEDKYLMALGYYLSKMYLSLNQDIDKIYARHRLELMTEQFEQTKNICAYDSVKMADAIKEHRLCNVTGKKYDINVKIVSFREFCDKTFVREGNDILDKRPQYNSILYGESDETSVGREDIEYMERFYYGTQRTMADLYFGENVGGPEFNCSEELSDPHLIVPYVTDNPVDYQAMIRVPDFAYCLTFWGWFHNPFTSEAFLEKEYPGYSRDDLNNGTSVWYSWPNCFTPIYYSEQ